MKRRLLLLILLLLPAQSLQAQQPAVRVEVVAQQVNVRAAPAGAVIGTLARGAQVDVTGLSEDRAWLYFLYWGQPAWMTSLPAFIRAYGDLSVLSSSGKIELVQYSIAPDLPEPDQPFTILLTLKAQKETGAFKIAATCAEFALLSVPRLASGVAQTVELHCPGDPATGPHSTELIIDVDQQVGGGHKQTLTYFVDRLYAQVKMDWPAYSDLNLDGLGYDLAFDGQNVRALHGAQLFALEVDSLALIHFDRLEPQDMSDVLPAVGVIGVITAEGRRGALQVMAIQGETAQVEFRVYGGST